MREYHPTISAYKQGAKTLPQKYYLSGEIFNREMDELFAKQWICAGRDENLKKSGDFVLVDIAGESLILVKDAAGKIHALFNVCRHRGTQICDIETGHFAMHIQCPYHAWTYDTGGNLVAAPHMTEVKNFDRSAYTLAQADVALWQGFIFVNIAKKPKSFEAAWGKRIKDLERFEIGKLKVGHSVTYDIKSNWKLVFQNYNECLHCPSIHPKLARTMPYLGPTNEFTDGPILGGPMSFTPPNVTATMSGKVCGRLISDSLPDGDRNMAFYYTLMPNFLLSIHPDYVNYYTVKPVAPDRTIVESQWLFHPDTLADKKNTIRDAVEFWDLTNRQDWDIIERSQIGISSRRYAPGPYSPRESIPAAWDRQYLKLMKK